MRVKIKSIIILICLFLPLAVYGKTSVWIAEKEGKKIILAGSVHLLKPSQLPLPDAYDKALEASQRIVFELDIDKLDQTDVGRKMLQAFKLNGVTLQQTLQPKNWLALEKIIKNKKVSFPLSSFDAAFVSFSLPLLIWQEQGYQAGIDDILYKKAKQQGKTIESLETFDEQLEALKKLRQMNPNDLIVNMLEELENPKLSLDRLIDDLYRGDQTILNEQIADYKKDKDTIFYQSLLVNRNQAWLVKIEQYTQDGVPTMVVAGAMHFAGEDGLLQQLAKRGYKITNY